MLALAACLAVVPMVPAQPFPVPIPVPTPFPIVQPIPVAVLPTPGLSVGFAVGGKRSLFTFNYNSGGYGVYPYYGYGFGYPAIAPPFASTNITQVFVQRPPILIPPAALPPFLQDDPAPAAGPLFGRILPPRPDDEDAFPPQLDRPMPDREPGKLRPMDPKPAVPPIPKQEEPPKKEAPPPPPPPPPDRLLPRQPPNPDPRQESVRLFDLGREAFARGEYGRAAERFRQAADLAPLSPLPYFYLAQAQLALGNHRRAFDALQVGLRLQPDWVREPFRPIDLYEDNPADYAEHLQLLMDLATATPDDPVILFLTAYQLWFDGRREEARPLFERAAPVLPDPNLVNRFLRTLPGGDVL
jgi:hypothetical protein